ncbi:MAG: hypothetical protein Q8P18_05445 [Pseudomonadota bacterium]|nr:hypothetical protein [Pseudomonadota bacterium]
MLLPLVILLPGCVSESACESERIDISDGETELGDLDFTVAELLAGLEGIRTFPASDDAGAPLSAELDIERGEGTAVFVDTTLVETRRAGIRLNVGQSFTFLSCEDVVEVPITFALTTADGSIAVEGEALARSEEWGDTSEGVGGVAFTHTVDRDVATLPAPPRGSAGAQVDAWFEGDHLEQASLSWVGTSKEALHFPPVQVNP